jgi:hypothetical protein
LVLSRFDKEWLSRFLPSSDAEKLLIMQGLKMNIITPVSMNKKSKKRFRN